MSLTLDLSPEDLRTGFYALTDVHDVADLLEITHERLIYNIYVIAPSKKYRPFEIPKASGQNRRILSPNSELKIIQQKLNQVLQAVYEPPKTTHGFVIGRSVRSNAELHIGQRYVFNIDLADFFPSINFGRVRGLLMAPPYSLPALAATVIAQICCFKNELPQGAPTSPIISNMICAKLDHQLLKLAWDENCIYTRYADDITFSSSQLFFPNKIARWVKNRQTWETGRPLAQLIANNGFIIHPSKVRMQTEGQRQMVTGIVVNERANLPRQYIRQIRAMLHAWQKYGLALAKREHLKSYSHKYRGPYKDHPEFEKIVKGKINYLGMVRGKDDPIYLRYRREFYDLCGQNVESDDNLSQVSSDNEDNKTASPSGVQFQLEKMETLDSQSEEKFDKKNWLNVAPFPLASILRSYDSLPETDYRGKVSKLIHFFEALAKLVSIIQLSGFINDTQELSFIRQAMHERRKFFTSPTLHDWAWLVGKLAKQIRSKYNSKEMRPQLDPMFKFEDARFYKTLGSKEPSNSLQNKINACRNYWHHGGERPDQQAVDDNAMLLAELNSIEEHFDLFWDNYFLISGKKGAKLKGKEEYNYEYDLLHGIYRKPKSGDFMLPLEFNGLYLYEKKTKQALPILPLLKVIQKPAGDVCYFFDKLDGNKLITTSYHFAYAQDDDEDFSDLESILQQLGPIQVEDGEQNAESKSQRLAL